MCGGENKTDSKMNFYESILKIILLLANLVYV